MNRKSTLSSGKRRRKVFTFLWIAALVILTMSLIYWEQVALLYILATLGVTALLVVVGLADLGGAAEAHDEIVQTSEASAIGSDISSSYKSNQSSSWVSRKNG